MLGWDWRYCCTLCKAARVISGLFARGAPQRSRTEWYARKEKGCNKWGIRGKLGDVYDWDTWYKSRKFSWRKEWMQQPRIGGKINREEMHSNKGNLRATMHGDSRDCWHRRFAAPPLSGETRFLLIEKESKSEIQSPGIEWIEQSEKRRYTDLKAESLEHLKLKSGTKE